MTVTWERYLALLAAGIAVAAIVPGFSWCAPPEDPHASASQFLDLGLYSLENGRHEQAEPAFDEAARTIPPDRDSLLPWGDFLEQTPHGPARDRFGQEVRARAVGATPNRAQAWLLLGNAWGKMGKWFSALNAWKRALNSAPHYAPAHLAVGVAWFKTDRLRQAVASFQRATTLAPECSQAHLCLAVALARLGRDLQASQALLEAKRLNPLFHQTHFFLGLVFNGLRDRQPVDPFVEYLNVPLEAPETATSTSPLPMADSEEGLNGVFRPQ